MSEPLHRPEALSIRTSLVPIYRGLPEPLHRRKGFIPGMRDKLLVGSGDRTTGIDLALDAGGLVVSGTVSDVGGGPIAGAEVTMKHERRSLDEGGEMTMPEVGKQIEVVNKDVTGLVVEMAGGVTVTGRVEPPQVATIGITPTMVGLANLFEAVKTALVRGESDATGAFTLRHVPPGDAKLDLVLAPFTVGVGQSFQLGVDRAGTAAQITIIAVAW